jgi:hypothetical protein
MRLGRQVPLPLLLVVLMRLPLLQAMIRVMNEMERLRVMQQWLLLFHTTSTTARNVNIIQQSILDEHGVCIGRGEAASNTAPKDAPTTANTKVPAPTTPLPRKSLARSTEIVQGSSTTDATETDLLHLPPDRVQLIILLLTRGTNGTGARSSSSGGTTGGRAMMMTCRAPMPGCVRR